MAIRALFRGTSKGAINHPATVQATVNRPNIIFAFTNELDLLRSSGFHIQGIEAAWTSGRKSDSLNKYAQHAIETLASTPEEHKPWIKSLLLSTYGMLGKRPSKYQSVSNLGGKSFDWPTPSGWIEGQIKQTSREFSPSTTNVIALGMIQAETRRNVIELARYLETLGVSVFALYADSLIVNVPSDVRLKGVRGKVTRGTLPILPPEWRVKSGLTNLRFFNPVSWISDQEERLPGIGREDYLRISRRRAIRARARELGGVESDRWLLDQAERHGIGARKVVRPT